MSLESKKLALLRIKEIFERDSDHNHQLSRARIAGYLDNDYGIVLERKAVARNIELLKDAGMDIRQGKDGAYLAARDFEDSELRLLIDGVLASRYIPERYSRDLIEKLCGLANRYFKSNVKHIHSVSEWGKTDNKALFYNIELIDNAIERKKQIEYDFNRYGADKKLHISSHQTASPYQLILHNQRYYLMARNEKWGDMVFQRLDRVTNLIVTERKATPLRSNEGYESGINYRELTARMPYLFTDRPRRIKLIVDLWAVDQIIDWFGFDADIHPLPNDKERAEITLKASPKAMEHWAMQYIDHVEVVEPKELRDSVRKALKRGLERYGG